MAMSYNPYNPYSYNPYQSNYNYNMAQMPYHQNSQMNQQDLQLTQVNGLGGAQNYQVPPNSRVVLFDSNQDVFYIKSTDAGGYPTINAYQFTPIQNQSGVANEYVTRNEFEELKRMVIDNGKLSVPESTE